MFILGWIDLLAEETLVMFFVEMGLEDVLVIEVLGTERTVRMKN